ncbi:uncharacterized protein EURHEDRAFT_223122 [Aspergillus ruber CBS 135680]|uniref:Uncharacterized protein n=1 Tax=Aspergillus ruber (strain CBS 135680) TaxID=1388766 RepID=A0A017SPM5_ASPRC|nr:uncharacterized protein EURHEDRAFT_223122 [Aspergillus ruber CBS 135680]EYE98761.1 hypothetical protein EURHEDRAFT_223122 [Aspergillus ruber CBS 135680]
MTGFLYPNLYITACLSQIQLAFLVSSESALTAPVYPLQLVFQEVGDHDQHHQEPQMFSFETAFALLACLGLLLAWK